MPNLPFPAFIDSTMLADFRLCKKKWEWRYLRHLVPAEANVNLSAGGAIAKALEVARRAFYERGHDQETAVALGLNALTEIHGSTDFDDTKKSWHNTARAFIYYCDKWPFAEDILQPYIVDGKATIEFSAAIDIPINHPTTGDPLLYTGRFDMLAQHQQLDSRQAFCVDEKTAYKIDKKWAEKWSVRGQFIGYTWMARKRGYDVAGAMVRGVIIHDHDFQVIDVPVYVDQWKIDDWYEGMLETVREMVDVWERAAFTKSLNDACGMYRGCDYLRLCDSKNPERWIDPHFKERKWNPLETEDKPE